jgi:hypothetical protein
MCDGAPERGTGGRRTDTGEKQSQSGALPPLTDWFSIFMLVVLEGNHLTTARYQKVFCFLVLRVCVNLWKIGK